MYAVILLWLKDEWVEKDNLLTILVCAAGAADVGYHLTGYQCWEAIVGVSLVIRFLLFPMWIKVKRRL